MENTKIKEWYTETFESDDLGKEINENATFYGLFEKLDNYEDIYEYLGENIDSVIRERIFQRLAEIMQVEYNYIYDQWLRA